jgi:acetyl esterase/lipase
VDIDPEFEGFSIVTPETYTGPAERRRIFAPIFAASAAAAVIPSGMQIVDRSVPGPSGNIGLKVRIYRPAAPAPLPALLYCHGGGFIFGDLDSEHARCIDLADGAGCVVVSVDYRLSPEHPYPAPVDDAYAALEWLVAEASPLGVDITRLAVGGTSAGGCIAAALGLASRDRGGPRIGFQLLCSPVLDDRLETPSAVHCTAVPIFSRFQAERMWRFYLGERAAPTPAYAAPARASSFRGLPPAYILACGLDPLRDEAVAYAVKLLAEDIAVELHVVPQVPHAFDLARPAAARSRQVLAEMQHALRRALARPAH